MRAALSALVLLAGCQREPVESAGAAKRCAVTPMLAALAGRPGTEATIAEARRLSGAEAVRRVEPGSAVTMDYRADRLNVRVDANGVVERLDCG